MGRICLTARVLAGLSVTEKLAESNIRDRTRRPSSKKIEMVKRKNYDAKYNNFW